jgi:molybdopterin/thiamine biosynthesis adenylyltransferase
MRIFTGSQKIIKRKTKEIEALSLYESYAHNVDGFSHLTLRKLKVVMAGAGGIGSEVGEGLVRKGIGDLTIIDHDKVELTNLNRQRFSKRDIGKYKVKQLTKKLSKEGFFSTTITGIPLKFEEAVEKGVNLACDVAICGVDSDPSRVFISKYYSKLGIPVIFTAVSESASNGYVFAQENEKACFGCFMPDALSGDKENPCPGSPSLKDILKVVSGVVLYVVDSLFMERLRVWNYKEIFLDGTIPEFCTKIDRKQDCKLCNS